MKNTGKKTWSKKSRNSVVIGSIVSLIGIVIAIVTGCKKRKSKLKEHPTKYKPV